MERNSTLRTEYSFGIRVYEKHHHGDSILEDGTKEGNYLDMIRDFPGDPTHLFDLGRTRNSSWSFRISTDCDWLEVGRLNIFPYLCASVSIVSTSWFCCFLLSSNINGGLSNASNYGFYFTRCCFLINEDG